MFRMPKGYICDACDKVIHHHGYIVYLPDYKLALLCPSCRISLQLEPLLRVKLVRIKGAACQCPLSSVHK